MREEREHLRKLVKIAAHLARHMMFKLWACVQIGRAHV